MAELSAGSGLESAAVRGRGGWNEFIDGIKARFAKRQRSQEATAVVPRVDEDVVDVGAVELDSVDASVADAATVEKTWSHALEGSNEEVVAFLRGLSLPEDSEKPVGIFGKQLSDEGKAALLALRAESETPADPSEIDAHLATLRAALAPEVSDAVSKEVVDGAEVKEGNVSDANNTEEVATSDEAAALRAATLGEFRVLSERFAMVQTERGALAVLEADVELSPDVHAKIAALVPVMKERVAGAAEAVEGEVPELLSFEEARADFDALLAELATLAQAERTEAEVTNESSADAVVVREAATSVPVTDFEEEVAAPEERLDVPVQNVDGEGEAHDHEEKQ